MKSVITQMTLFMAALVLPAVNLEAQTLNILHSLNAGSNNSSGVYTNNDGTCPEANLLLSGNTLYGTAHNGGINGYGTVFKVNTDGMGFTVLHTFTAPVNLTNIDGINPRSSLVLSSNTLYGTTSGGGAYGGGTVFAVNTNGTAFTNVYNFGSIFTSGYSPQAGLVLSGNTLYGTTQNRDLANGAVFRINTDGTAFTNIHSFSVGSHTSQGINTNSDGIQPYSALVLASNVLYGTTQLGGTSGDGTVFRLNTDGTDFTNLHNFTGVLTSYLQTITNSDGANPYAGLVLSGNTLFGTAFDGGTNAAGTVFAVNTDGTDFTNLWTFTPYNGTDTNYGGASPFSSLFLSGSTLYGTTSGGSTNGPGTAFSISTNGTGFTELYFIYSLGTNASGPYAGLVLSGNTLYGTTFGGGIALNGTVFELTLPVPINLNIQVIGGKVVLNWTNPAFSLQASPTISGTFSNVTGATSPHTNTITGSQQFFRLQAN